MKGLNSILRISGLVLLAVIMSEALLETERSAFQQYPILWLVLTIIIIIAIAIEVSIKSLENVLYQSLDEKQRIRYDAAIANKRRKRYGWIQKTYDKLLDKKPLEKEEEILLDHNYDGIKELDNSLPPWWLYGFYASIIFAFVYLARFHIFDGTSQREEYEIEIAEAKAAIEEYKKTAKDLIDENTVELLTGTEDVNAGKMIFQSNCVACHKVDAGGGIGPNLTDDYWILGGGIKNIFHTVSEGGRPGKGMVSWKTDLKPGEIAQVASYIISLHGTTPADPKDPEGEIWVDPDAPIDEVQVKQKDSLIEVIIEDNVTTKGPM